MPDTLLAPRLARFVAQHQLVDLPPDVLADARRLILDTLACMIAGTTVQPRHAMIRALARPTPTGSATIVGDPGLVDPEDAALVNAEAGAVLSAQDSFFFSHTANLTLAVSLALVESRGGSGRDLLEAFVAGFETMSVTDLLGPARPATLDPTPGVTPAGVRRPFVTVGAAAAAARALELAPEQTAHALAIAAASAPGEAGVHARLSAMNYYTYFDKARAGVTAARLAYGGFTGHPELLATLLTPGSVPSEALLVDRAWLLDGLGTRWWLSETSLKTYPSCRYLSGALEAFDELLAQTRLAPEEIEQIVVRLSPTAAGLPMIAAAGPLPASYGVATPLDLVFNAPYQLALLALGVRPGPSWYDPTRLQDPDLRSFMTKVRVEVDLAAGERLRAGTMAAPHHRIAQTGSAGLEVRGRGRTWTDTREFVRGDPWRDDLRPTDETVAAKFHSFCDGLLVPAAADRVIDLVLRLEEVADVRELTALLRGPEPAPSRSTRLR